MKTINKKILNNGLTPNNMKPEYKDASVIKSYLKLVGLLKLKSRTTPEKMHMTKKEFYKQKSHIKKSLRCLEGKL